MNLKLKSAWLNFLWAYLLITVLAYGVSYGAQALYDLPSAYELGLPMFEDPAFKKTVVYHLLINLVMWVFFAYRYFKPQRSELTRWKQALPLCILWLVTALLVDLVFFVLIKSPISLTFHQFYIEYQPWISLTYLILFISPIIALYWVMRKK